MTALLHTYVRRARREFRKGNNIFYLNTVFYVIPPPVFLSFIFDHHLMSLFRNTSFFLRRKKKSRTPFPPPVLLLLLFGAKNVGKQSLLAEVFFPEISRHLALLWSNTFLLPCGEIKRGSTCGIFAQLFLKFSWRCLQHLIMNITAAPKCSIFFRPVTLITPRDSPSTKIQKI